MRKLLVASGIVLLATASAQAAWVVSLVNTATGLGYIPAGSGTYTISVVISDPADGYMMIGGGGDVVTTPGLTATRLVLNTVDFDSDLTTDNTTDPNQHFEIMTFGKGPYTAPMSIATFTLTAANVLGGEVTMLNAIVGDDQFGTNEATVVPLVVFPEPATALLLMGALPFLRRRHA